MRVGGNPELLARNEVATASSESIDSPSLVKQGGPDGASDLLSVRGLEVDAVDLKQDRTNRARNAETEGLFARSHSGKVGSEPANKSALRLHTARCCSRIGATLALGLYGCHKNYKAPEAKR